MVKLPQKSENAILRAKYLKMTVFSGGKNFQFIFYELETLTLDVTCIQ